MGKVFGLLAALTAITVGTALSAQADGASCCKEGKKCCTPKSACCK